jgi:uncharacterized repeat protein (TIGR03803 family)
MRLRRLLFKNAFLMLLFFGFAPIIGSAQTTFTTLYNFEGPSGSDPQQLVQGADGSFYGLTFRGGAYDSGSIFKITPTGAFTLLYSFCAEEGCPDGNFPNGSLLLGTDGNFYGATAFGGASGVGTVFRFTPAGNLTTLYSFSGSQREGYAPNGGLVEGRDGQLYGTTTSGGRNANGTIFKMSLGGHATTLYHFCSLDHCADGTDPTAGLILGSDGNFYGTTAGSGFANAGTVFKFTPTGTLTTLYTFCQIRGCVDGAFPYAALIEGKDGNFYGTTSYSADSGAGTLFRITPSGFLTVLAIFNLVDGDNPNGQLVQAADQSLFGTTAMGGAPALGDGNVFTLPFAGTVTTLHAFDGTDGEFPGGLVQGTDGNFYGTTSYGGTNNAGTIFSISDGFGPFVAFVRNWAKVGEPVGILGQGFNGTIGVSFNGVPAKFSVESDTFLTATVPLGASSGYLMVSTVTADLKSNTRFLVTH